MPNSIIQFLLESSICLLFFYLLFHFILRKETFFQLNRVYLLITPVIAFLIPFLHIYLPSYTAEAEEVGNSATIFIYPAVSEVRSLETMVWQPVHEPADPFAFSLGEILLAIYLLGFTITLLKKGIMVWQVSRWISNQKSRIQHQGCTLIEVPESFPSASFFNFIFINSNKLGKDKTLVLEHELVHVKQRHSLDILFHELLVTVFWFHPLVYLFRNRIKEIHEYIADYSVTQTVDPFLYAKTLVAHLKNETQAPVWTNTFHSITQKRLAMLAQSPSPFRKTWKYLLILPMLGALTLLFSFDLAEDIKSAPKAESLDIEAFLEEHLPEIELKRSTPVSAVVATTVEESRKEITRLNPIDPKPIKSLESTSPTPDLPNFKIDFSAPLACVDTVPKKGSEDIPTEKTTIRIRSSQVDTNPLFVIDGVIFEEKDRHEMLQELDPKDIETITVIKGKAAIEKYNDEGKNGVIIIETKGFTKLNKRERKKRDSKVKPVEIIVSEPVTIQEVRKDEAGNILKTEVPVDRPISMEIYPNAATDMAHVKFQLHKQSQMVAMDITDMNGRVIREIPMGELVMGTYDQEISRQEFNLSAGTYLVRLTIDGQQIIKRLVFAD